MKRFSFFSAVIVLAATFLGLAVDWTPAPTRLETAEVAEPTPQQVAAAPQYSPFLVAMSVDERELPFEQISFKDVGMSLPAEDRSYVYETLANSLAHALASHDEPLTSEVQHTPSLMDPDTHLACTAGHIYVDVWQSERASGPTWGYSLWSGCGEDDQFAHREVPVGAGDALASVAPLARDIASSLRRAVETSCFTKRC